MECEILIALQRAKGRCVVVGDPCQLPATVIQRPGAKLVFLLLTNSLKQSVHDNDYILSRPHCLTFFY